MFWLEIASICTLKENSITNHNEDPAKNNHMLKQHTYLNMRVKTKENLWKGKLWEDL